MTEHEAVSLACAEVGIHAPKAWKYGHWTKADVVGARNGKGDGRLIVNDTHATAWNWQTGESKSVRIEDEQRPADRSHVARRIADDRRQKSAQAERAAKIAEELIRAATPSQHPYLVTKGFQHERALVIDADDACRIGGDYLGHECGQRAIVIPARFRQQIVSVQLIWEDGTKRFLFGGAISGATHRVAAGNGTWLCEGFATALTIRKALRDFGNSSAVLCCFSAANIATVAAATKGRCMIVADNDAPRPQYGDLGAGEFFARKSGKPYTMPPKTGQDFNDLFMEDNIFVAQRLLADFLKGVPM